MRELFIGGLAVSAPSQAEAKALENIINRVDDWDRDKIILAEVPHDRDVIIATTKRLKQKNEDKTRSRVRDVFDRGVDFIEVTP